MKKKTVRRPAMQKGSRNYTGLVGGIGELLKAARRASARTINALMTATYWEVGRRIVEFEQRGADRAKYGKGLLVRLSADLGRRCERGFSPDILESMRQFYRAFPPGMISETLSRKLAERPVNNARTAAANAAALPAAVGISAALIGLRVAGSPGPFSGGFGVLSHRGAARRVVG